MIGKPDRVTLNTGAIIYKDPYKKETDGIIKETIEYTIIDEITINGETFGKLDGDTGWVILKTDKSETFHENDLVSITSDASYYGGASMPEWVKSDRWFITKINGTRVVLGKNETSTRYINSPVDTKYLTKVNP